MLVSAQLVVYQTSGEGRKCLQSHVRILYMYSSNQEPLQFLWAPIQNKLCTTCTVHVLYIILAAFVCVCVWDFSNDDLTLTMYVINSSL